MFVPYIISPSFSTSPKRTARSPWALGRAVTGAPTDTNQLDLKEPIGKSNHGVIHFQLKLHGLVVPDKHNGNPSRMEVLRLGGTGE